MNIVLMLLVGLIAGTVAKLIMPGKDPGGIVVTILLGVAGSFLGGLIARAVGFEREGSAVTIVMAIVGSVLLLAIYRLYRGRRGHSTRPRPSSGAPILDR
jgi:uncharacterized membrane protein YeaQ/YmgE (transglycosylase-associated protein family)